MDPICHLLVVKDLTTSFKIRRGIFPAIRNISFHLSENETLALVGESGCGKSITALSIMRLVPEPAGRITSGQILFKEKNLLELSEDRMRKIRGNQMAMIFQEPMTSLNPVLTVGLQITEPLFYHQSISKKDGKEKALEIMRQVRIPSAENRFSDYPHQFSGGMRQRVMIAMALACQPDIIMADEPTTALDVTIQAQILSLLADLKQERKMSMIFITHNLGIVARIADRVAIMYGGEIVEISGVNDLFDHPVHPYTEALLSSVPRIDRTLQKLSFIPGQVPSIDRMPQGCHYATRCLLKRETCEQQDPDLIPIHDVPDHFVRCWVRGG
ncbi:MAG TPA: ABC transporter ATP-binding protein [Thermodesulfobacteriota bacterium]|nr:ABC transporter ATP-binding protein [Thermodesulfobacteriota bacterium]